MATAGGQVRNLDNSIVKWLPRPLREARRAWLAIPLAVALSLPGSLLIALELQSFAPDLPPPDMTKLRGVPGFLALDVFAPFVETLIMAGFLTLFLRFMPPTYAILLSAAGWGVAHSMQALAWGPPIAWAFFIFSTLFVVWRQRGFWPAVGVAAATHMLHNFYPSWMVAFG